MVRVSYLALCISMSVSSSAMSCEIDTPTAWLPGMSREQAEKRRRAIYDAYFKVRDEARTEALVAEAKVIYLARVIRSEPIDEKFQFSSTVQPVKPITGSMPKSTIFLIGAPDSCGNPTGDGFGAQGKVGELVVVFEGVGKTQARPRGRDSVRMVSVLTGSLLDSVQEWLSKQPDYIPVY